VQSALDKLIMIAERRPIVIQFTDVTVCDKRTSSRNVDDKRPTKWLGSSLDQTRRSVRKGYIVNLFVQALF
jgi:hypothetical protein